MLGPSMIPQAECLEVTALRPARPAGRPTGGTAAGRLLVFNCFNCQEVFVWRQEAVTSRPSLAEGVFIIKSHYLFIIKSHLQSYPCPININCFWNAGFLLVISIVLQLITGILLALHYTPDINYSYYSIIREVEIHIL